MRCDHDVLLDHLDGELDPARNTEVEDHLAHCEACRAAADAYRQDLALVGDAFADDPADALTDAELDALLSAPELGEETAGTGRLLGLPIRPPRAAVVLALAAVVLLALLLKPSPPTEVSTHAPSPAAVAEVSERVEIRMATGNPSNQVIWVMSKDVEF